ncbi:hypothetical protein PUNSTDRAFT_43255 [Punctularia strigosozonata HHB-11173 SS5]|uniref:uncharacterized protein n=1 Tax=Punctularia strigosozonata (strain HHB-11173) TaxID=741275 RepID=UPI0004418175|nr:uncharacterized protein PUNSTDRAFT_43255 [Punctularia strigosozonata HHB-11173 SS5]EIN10288.1 hypothetical protein PUNSTDRAFT_43255 [Punctularia strigosozonata HHB-11173 SS5]
MRCPMKGCFHVFASLSALALHLDAQKCPGGVTREQIDRYIIQHDLRGLISNRGRMITRGTLNASYKPPAIYKATELAWNGSAYQCYFCPITFRTLGELDWHLASPKHSNGTVNGGKIYRCPNTGNCGKQFSTLSGAVQHIERGNCGILKIRGVKDTMEGLIPPTVACFGLDCSLRFIDYSALALHLDSSKCPSGIARAKVDRWLLNDAAGESITNQRLELPYHPPYQSRPVTRHRWILGSTRLSCDLCPKTLKTVNELQEHITSSKHNVGYLGGGHKVYRCPNEPNCAKTFTTFSATVQHLEHSPCKDLGLGMVQNVLRVLAYYEKSRGEVPQNFELRPAFVL